MWSSGGKNQWANMKHESRTRSGVKWRVIHLALSFRAVS